MILMVPRDVEVWPSLGGQVCDFVESNMTFGKGDLRGIPVQLDDLRRLLIWRIYEVYPKGHALAGRRRFKRVGLSLPKGVGKTELAAMIALCELHPEAPVRFDGWTKGGEPIGRPVTDPYIPLLATSQEQSDELCFTFMRTIIENSPLKDDFYVTDEVIERRKGDGKAEALSTNPNSRDGALTTFCHVDESHRLTLARHKQAFQVSLTNISKRFIADGWLFETTTAFEPGAGSVAEATMDYAKAVESGKVKDSTLFYFHQQASEDHDLTTTEGRMEALKEASGPAWVWRDLRSASALWDDPSSDATYNERVYLNWIKKGSAQAFDVTLWKQRAQPREIPLGRLIVVGFDGSLFNDSTALVAEDVEWGYQWPVGIWERPAHVGRDDDWKVPAHEVDAKVHELFEKYNVWRIYCDPFYWETWVAKWEGEFGKDRIITWPTNQRSKMCRALQAFNTAIREGTISHDGSPVYTRHIGNARRKNLRDVDETGKPLWLIEKERHDSPNKIDIAMAGVLAREARNDAVAAGLLEKREPMVMIVGGRR